MQFADIIVDISVKSLDRPFQYRIPESMEADAVIGALVEIPFGKGNRIMRGYIIDLSDTPRFDVTRTKEIVGVVRQGVVAESHLLTLAHWMKRQYGGTMNDAIKAVMPVRREIREKQKRQVCPTISRQEMFALRETLEKKHQTARVRVLDALLSATPYEAGVDYDFLCRNYKATLAVLSAMEEKGILTITSARLYRNPYENIQTKADVPDLNAEQQEAVNRICRPRALSEKGDISAEDEKDAVQKNERNSHVYLLHGVTGSGKTEVYMQCIDRVISAGKQAIVLIPEIALTLQTVNRFYARFGDKVSVLHSRLSAGERSDQYTRAKNGEISIMIGPRSALFTPFERLGLIVIDEEHEGSYRSESMPKYHAREVAVKRAEMLGADVILGSATPSIEAYYLAEQGEYEKIILTERAGGARLPSVEIVDLRRELEEKNYSVFSRSLAEKMRERLAGHEQMILFLNRRGYAGFVSCRKCGEVPGCPHCAVSLKPHSRYGKVSSLQCHYCGYEIPMPDSCPKCGSKYIGMFGLGTEQVEQMVAKQFPDARVIRMDADTTGGKEGHDRVLEKFAGGEADILVGTQMIVKGHDFPRVTLVGVLAADLSLHIGDYRAAERTYQLLAQAAGRAGRGKRPGEVVLQTYQPEHYSVVCAAAQDYESFYRQEVLMRQVLQYPPVSHILEILVLSKEESLAKEFAKDLADKLRCKEELHVLGASEASIGKLRDIFRYVVYGKSADMEKMIQAKDELEEYIHGKGLGSRCTVQFSFD
ncbi:MAG: primosomal protein N' [Lachnospiraceae bacterium]|nr:primosomal protein N' [Lachnospiraceae bacterium]